MDLLDCIAVAIVREAIASGQHRVRIKAIAAATSESHYKAKRRLRRLQSASIIPRLPSRAPPIPKTPSARYAARKRRKYRLDKLAAAGAR